MPASKPAQQLRVRCTGWRKAHRHTRMAAAFRADRRTDEHKTDGLMEKSTNERTATGRAFEAVVERGPTRRSPLPRVCTARHRASRLAAANPSHSSLTFCFPPDAQPLPAFFDLCPSTLASCERTRLCDSHRSRSSSAEEQLTHQGDCLVDEVDDSPRSPRMPATHQPWVVAAAGQAGVPSGLALGVPSYTLNTVRCTLKRLS
jgi:hypothetical protein